jgi:hypothetical protein
MILDDPGLGCENRDMDASGAHGEEVVATSDLDHAAMSQRDNRSTVIATSASLSPEIPERDNGTTLDGEGRLRLSLPEDSIVSPSDKRSRSPNGLDRADCRGSDWIFDVFAEDDSETEGVGFEVPEASPVFLLLA